MESDKYNRLLDERIKRAKVTKNLSKSVSSLISDEVIVEQVYVDGRSGFCIYDRESKEISYEDNIMVDGVELAPISGDLVDRNVVRFPSEMTKYLLIEDLRKEIIIFIHKYLDVIPFYEELVSYYILLSWVFDKNSVVPYLGIYGDYGSGKTRAAQTIGILCYKPIFISGAITMAPIYRVLEIARGTLIINEFDFDNSDMGSEMIKVLNNGYENGQSVLRVKGDGSGTIEAFNAFSPKIFTYRKKKKDQAFESRLITIEVEETNRMDIPSTIPGNFYDEALKIRNKLLYFRFNNLFIDIKIDESIFNGVDKRLRQTLTPLLSVVDDEAFVVKMKGFIKEINLKSINDRGQSYAADNLQVLVDLIKLDPKGTISIRDYMAAINLIKDGMNEKHITDKMAGSIVRNDLRLKTEKITQGEKRGRYGIVIVKEKIEVMCQRYGVESPWVSSLSSLSLPQSQVAGEHGEHSGHAGDWEKEVEEIFSL